LVCDGAGWLCDGTADGLWFACVVTAWLGCAGCVGCVDGTTLGAVLADADGVSRTVQ
jgi:hypothetical protein